MGPPKSGAPGNCPVCPPLKPALFTPYYAILYIWYTANLIDIIVY